MPRIASLQPPCLYRGTASFKKNQCNYSLEFSGFWHVTWLSRPNIILGHVVPRCVAISLARFLYIDLIYVLNPLYYIWNIVGFHAHNVWKREWICLRTNSPPESDRALIQRALYCRLFPGVSECKDQVGSCHRGGQMVQCQKLQDKQ